MEEELGEMDIKEIRRGVHVAFLDRDWGYKTQIALASFSLNAMGASLHTENGPGSIHGCVCLAPENSKQGSRWLRALDFSEFDNQECDVLDELRSATKC